MLSYLGLFEVSLTLVLLILLVGPPILYLLDPWKDRRDEILGCLTGTALALYFQHFYPSGVPGKRTGRHVHPETGHQAEAQLRMLYNHQFGRRRYVLPLVVIGTVGVLILAWTAYTLSIALGLRPSGPGVLPWLAVAGFAGAYIWVVDDLLRRWMSRDYSPARLWASALRLVLGAPLGFAVTPLLTPDLGVPVAFLLGVFPTTTVSVVSRRLLDRKAGLGDAGGDKRNELESLQGVNPAIAERFADEGVSTIVQLAYANPLDLTMRCSSLAFSFVVDCASQALAWLYLEDKLPPLRPLALRGAQEISNLVSELDTAGAVGAAAAATLTKCASTIGMSSECLERTFREIGGDPYTTFICSVWCVEDENVPPREEEAAGGAPSP